MRFVFLTPRFDRWILGGFAEAASSAANAAEALPVLVPQLVDALLGASFLGYTFYLDPLSGVISGAAGALAVLGGALEGRRQLVRKRELLAATRSEIDALHEIIVGIETIKSESAEGRVLGRWLERVGVEERAALRLRLSGSLLTTLLAALERAVFASVLLVLAWRCLTAGASVADLVAAVQASAGFMMSAQKLALLPSALADYRGDVERVDDVLAAPVEGAQASRRAAPEGPALVLRDVWFRYETDAPWVLRQLDLAVERGAVLVLRWPSGAGKSTLLRLLSGLLAPSRGDVLVHGVDAVHARRQVSYIPQHASLLPMSVLDNLRTLSGCRDAQRLLAAAEATGLLAIAAAWGMGMETVIALGGANVSSGERQLILLTAAVASEAPVLLLDEALAHVDAARRRRIDAAELFRGRTVVTVLHDAPAHSSSARLSASVSP